MLTSTKNNKLVRNRVNEININIFFKGYNSKSAMCKLGNEYVIMT